MYRLIVEYYQLVSQDRVHAAFEHEEGGKTQRLAVTGISWSPEGHYSNSGHAECLGQIDGLLPLLTQMLAARLDTELPID